MSKFNLVGPEEINNLELAKMIAKAQNKELKYEMVIFIVLDQVMIYGMHWMVI